MPKLIRLYILQVLAGFGLSAVFVGALLWFNVANLWHLISGSDMGVVAVLMLFMFNGIVFAGVQFAISIMRMGEGDDTSGGKRQHVRSQEPAPVRVAAEAPRSRTLRGLQRR
ncbi:hypothetical protein [Mameliella alba]|uniref:hypothetical protein n=1 Tax=Mameliella alba TaxID=561184 RepID=UPI000B52D08A|nr:hypothetical protein [Mameliella alba]MBY6118390.1 hypothetical protein [Mameliella alba]OWV43337.1 hypothetical protein CDZ95_11155 [Mameliella alba]OWV68474.1 hypothetical protein CDZ97_01510 [Mameliella alba]